jgi:hypothetical protein
VVGIAGHEGMRLARDEHKDRGRPQRSAKFGALNALILTHDAANWVSWKATKERRI